MACKYREEIVGKRFLSVSGYSNLKLDKISEWGWRAGVIRAATYKDNTHKDLQVLVEYDDVEWHRREWISLYKDSIFHMFLVEHGLVWGHRSDPFSNSSAAVLWPALTFTALVSTVDLAHNQQPLEFLLDKEISFCDHKQLKPFQEWDVTLPGIRDYLELRAAARRWTEQQDGQRILLATPSVLVGYRVEVYRAEGTTQWYTAVIVGYNEATRELTVTDDTVLEEHNEDPTLVQMRLIGDGVVESIMRGENVGITARRSRSAVLQAQHQQPGRVVRVTTSSAVNARKPRIGKPTLVSDPVLQTSPEPPDKAIVTTKPIRKRKSSENESSCQGAGVAATLRLRSTPHYNNNSPSSIKEDLENNKLQHQSRSRKASSASIVAVASNSIAGNNSSHQQSLRNKKKLLEETNSSKIRNLQVRVEDCLQIAARSEALSAICRRNSEEKSADCSSLSSTTLATSFTTPNTSPTYTVFAHSDNPTLTTPSTQIEEHSPQAEEGSVTEDEPTIIVSRTNLHDSNNSSNSSTSSSSNPSTPLPTLTTLTSPPTVDVIELADSASSCDTANSGGGGDSTAIHRIRNTTNGNHAVLDAELLAVAGVTTSDADVEDDDHDAKGAFKSVVTEWKPFVVCAEDVDKRSRCDGGTATTAAAITVASQLHTVKSKEDCTVVVSATASEAALTAVTALVDVTPVVDSATVVEAISSGGANSDCSSNNATVVEERAATATATAATPATANVVSVDVTVDATAVAVTKCEGTGTDGAGAGSAAGVVDSTVVAGASTVTITTRPLRTSEPCGGHPVVVDDERPATPLLQQLYNITGNTGRMETSSVGSVGSVGSDCGGSTAVGNSAAATAAGTSSATASPAPPLTNSGTNSSGSNESLLRFVVAGSGSNNSSNGGSDDRSDSGVSSLRSGSSGDERSGSRSSALSSSGDDLMAQQQQQQQTVSQQPHQREQGGGVVQGGGRTSRSPVFAHTSVSGAREEPTVHVWRDPTLENEPHIRHIHSIQHQQMKLSQSIDQSRKHIHHSLLMSHPSTNVAAIAAAAAAGVNVSVTNNNGVPSIPSNLPLSLSTSSNSVMGGSGNAAAVTASSPLSAAAAQQHLYNPIALQPSGITTHPGLVPPSAPPPTSSSAAAMYAAELMSWKQHHAAAIAVSRGAAWAPPPSITSTSAAVTTAAEEERRLLVERDRERERVYQERERLLREQQSDRVRDLQAKDQQQQQQREREHRDKQEHLHHSQHLQLHHQQQRERYEHERQLRHEQQQRDREREHLILRQKDQQQQERERQKAQDSVDMVDQHFKESLKRAQHKSASSAWPLMSIHPSSASSASVAQQQQHRNAVSVAAAVAADDERKRHEIEMFEHMQRVDQQRAAAAAAAAVAEQQQRHHHHHHHLSTPATQVNQQRIEPSARYYTSSTGVTQRPASVPTSGGKVPHAASEYHPPPAHSRSSGGVGGNKINLDKQQSAHPASMYHHPHAHHPSSQSQHKSSSELTAAAAAALHGYPTYQPTTFFATTASAAAGRDHHIGHHSGGSGGGGGHHKGLTLQQHGMLKDHSGLASSLSPSMMTVATAAAEQKNSVIVKHEKNLSGSSHHIEARGGNSIVHSPGPPKMPPLGGHYLPGGPQAQSHKLYEYRSPTQSPHHLTPSPHHLSGESKGHHRSPSGAPLSSPHHAHHPPPPSQQPSPHHPSHHSLHPSTQPSPQQQQQPPHHRQSPHGLSPGLVSSQQQQQQQQHSAHGGSRYRTNSEPAIHQSQHVQHYIQQQQQLQRERERDREREEQRRAAYTSYPPPSALTGASGSIYAPPTDHRLIAGSLISSAPSAITTPPATSGSSTGKPKVSSPAPHQIFGKPSLTPPGSSSGGSVPSPIPLTAGKVHHLAASPSPYQQMQPYSLSHNQGLGVAPPPAHSSRDIGSNRYLYERGYPPAPSMKPSIQHVTGAVPLAIISQPHLPSSAPLPTRHHHSHISAQQQLPPVLAQTQQQLPSIHHMSHHLPRHVVNHPHLAQQQQQPQYMQQPATHAVQTHPLDLGMSSSGSGRCEQMPLSPKRKSVGPPSNNAPVCLEVKKRRMELTNNTIHNSSSTISPLPCVSTNIYHPHDPHGQGQPHLTSPQPVAVLSRVSEPTPLLSTAAATTITTVINASLYNHPSTVNTTINLSTHTGRSPVAVSAAMLPRSPGALTSVLPDLSVTAVGITIAENKDSSEDGSTGALPVLSTAYASDNEVKRAVMFSQPVNLTPPPTTTTPTQENVLTPPTSVKTEPDIIVKTEPGLTIKTEPDLTVRNESGFALKTEYGFPVKIESSGHTVESEPRLTVKTELSIAIDTDSTIRSTSSPLPSAPMPSTILLSSSSASAHNNTGNYPVRHLKKAWLQRHTTGEHVDRSESSHSSTFLYGSCSSGNVTPASITTASATILTVTREPGMVNSLHNIGSMAVNSINKSKHFQSKSNNRSSLVRRKGTKDSSSLNGDISKDDSSSSDQERGRKSPPKRKPPKVKRRKGMVGRRPGDKKTSKTSGGGGGGSTGGGSSVLGSESGSDSDKDTGSDKDSDSGASTTPLKKSNNGNSSSTPPISLNLSANCMLKDTKGQEPRKRGRRPKTKNDKGEEPRIKKSKDHITENFRDTVGSEDNHASSAAAAEAAIAATTAAIAASTLSTIGALTFSSSNASTGGVAAPPRDPFRKPPIGQLKKTGETFLQDGPCFEVAPKLAKCRECRWTPNQRSKNMPNIFCRFYAFRRLRYTKNGQLAIAGFSDPHTDAYEDDIKLWLPSSDTPPADLNMESSRFILRQVGDHFCNLLVQEKDAHREHMSDDKTIAWKRVVQGVREMCDVCETTLFNFHWACGKCGFVVCLDCYKGRKRDIIKIWYDAGRDRDEYSWLLCTNRSAHEQDRLMLTQIIAGDSLNKLGKLMHEMREMWHVDQYCNCAMSKEISLAAMKTNAIRKEMIRGLIRMEMNGMKREVKEEPIPPQQNGQKEGWNIGPEMASPSNDDKKNDDSDSEGSYSHLRELLTSSSNRPKQPNGSRSESPTSTQSFPPPSVPHIKKKSKLDSVDEVIFSVIEESIPRPDLHCNNPFADPRELRHYIPRDNAEIKYRGLLPVRVLTLTESKVLYPGIPHNWLCHGKLLRLSDSTNPGNYRIFQDQWKRGQPVLISDITKHMDRSLWTPDSFASDFGEEKNDLVNCLTGSIVTNQPMRKFWEGFENPLKRLKDDSGNPMLLKLKDWPPAEDFAEMLPSRFSDLMKVLPLPDYTHRSGRLNLAGHLPDCFVRPDLGPKMYTAYGSALHPSKGTTNLHLDISDAVNVMVYVGIPKDGNNDEHIKEAFRAIDDAGCDILTKRRIRDKGELPGALWHIYNSRDADKIRDLLNKMVVENGGSLKPNHDPIHDQSRYLDGALRERLYKEYGVEGYAIVQCLGDAVFIPAGAPHQVRNLHNCIKVAEDFVSPENVSQCFHLTQEFRELTHAHTNHEDKLQIKNIIYHAVKDSLSTLSSILNKHLSADNSIGCNTTNTTDIKTDIKTEIKSEVD